ncbi:DUF3703 domain-containing protein [Solimonas sp. K1W22B-7]|uniref:DUF3703 domain-containing protein n=1 Tax=Solimonas sp. K1W22B-7 TaxID=2303331 RepID=UPI000E3335B2|nr:DUF3703 domain-containing protein [Solimonas sp. K1W22B-7]AXQ28847.1 DUF3703 domain-containing protein [Solimonas sp. K1W22B-7]
MDPLKEAIDHELLLGSQLLARHSAAAAFRHFERAHILSQRRTWDHLRSHAWMWRAGWLRRDVGELLGQTLRMVAALVFSRVWVPEGNTGGAGVSAFRPMPVPEDLRAILQRPRPRLRYG